MSNTAPTPQESSFDYLQPFMSVAIVTPDKVYPLWSSGSLAQNIDLQTEPGLDDLKALSYLTEIIVEEDLGRIPTITLTLQPPFEDAIKFLDSTLVEFGQNQIRFQFGYSNGASVNGKLGPILSPVYQGLMVRTPNISIGTDVSIQLIAHAISTVTGTATHQGTTKGPDTVRNIVNDILIGLGYDPDFSEVKGGSGADTALQKTITYAMSWNTAMATVYDLLRQARCRLIIEPPDVLPTGISYGHHKAVIVPVATDAANPPDFTLAMFNYQSGMIGSATYPILNVSTDTGALWLPGIKKLMLADVDPMTKKQVAKEVADSDAQAARTAKVPGNVDDTTAYPNPKIEKFSDYIFRTGAPDDPTAVQAAQGAFEVLTRAMGIPLTVETIGVPSVRPGMIAAVKGLGFRLSTPYAGTYGIRKVTHVLNTSGYTTTLEMTSNVGSFISKQIQLSSDGPQQSNPAPTGDTSGSTDKQAQNG